MATVNRLSTFSTNQFGRRSFLAAAAGAIALGVAGGSRRLHAADSLFDISLAQWSLHKRFFAKEGDPLDFPKMAKQEFGINAVEYVNQFYFDQGKNADHFKELRKRADDVGVKGVLIMCDREGALGDPDEAARKKAVENHYKWVDAASILGCHCIRVNASSGGTYREQIVRAADGLRQLTEYGAKQKIGVIVENHGGLSSNGSWLAAVMREVNHPLCGTLPDFGNFRVGGKIQYDRYQGVNDLMPFALGVSAKSHDFDADGNEIHTDYRKMLEIVLSFGYRGYVGIEYEGSQLSEPDGIMATKKLLERVRAELT